MPKLRSNLTSARIVSAVSTLVACALVLPAAAAAAPPSDQLVFDPPSYDFGLQPLYETSQASLQLRNEGEGATQLFSAETSGPDSGAFWTNGDCYYGRVLNPGESCSVQVYFSAYEARPFVAEVRIDSEAGSAGAALAGEGGRPVFSPATDPTNFGSIAVGSSGVTRTIDVTNTGNLAGGVFIAVISGGAVGSFQLLDENCTNVIIQPGSTCNAQVRFQPLSAGAKTARLSLFGESDGGTQITLSGVGLEPESEVSSDSHTPAAVKPSSKRTKAKARARRAKARARSRARTRRARARARHRRALRRTRRAAVASRTRLR